MAAIVPAITPLVLQFTRMEIPGGSTFSEALVSAALAGATTIGVALAVVALGLVVSYSMKRTLQLSSRALTIDTTFLGRRSSHLVFPLETLSAVEVGGSALFPTLLLVGADGSRSQFRLGNRADCEAVVHWLAPHIARTPQLPEHPSEIIPIELEKLSRAAIRSKQTDG